MKYNNPRIMIQWLSEVEVVTKSLEWKEDEDDGTITWPGGDEEVEEW